MNRKDRDFLDQKESKIPLRRGWILPNGTNALGSDYRTVN
jgi:hypothetical protein